MIRFIVADKADVEAAAGLSAGSYAFALDTKEWGGYDGSTWTWGGSGYTPPTTTAANDFQVGDGSGSWIKKTLAQTITILRTSLDSIYSAITHDHDTDYSDISHTHAHSALTGIGTGDHHAENHSHGGSPTQKLVQANTHESPDTDSGTSSLHHTIGTGANQAAAGNHNHSSTYQPLDSDLTDIAALSPANDSIIQRKSGAWTSRTVAQFIVDLGLGTFAFLSSLAHSSLSGIGANDHHNQSHDHSASGDGQSLAPAGTFALTGDITPTALSANQNNYNPTGWGSATVMRLQASDANRVITGLAGGTDGRIAVLVNIGSPYVISIQDENGSSSAANRFALPVPSASFMQIPPGTACVLQYDSTASRWRPITITDHFHIAGRGNNSHDTIDTHLSSTHLAFNDGEGDPADPGSAAADGTSSYAARRDHVHKGPKKAVLIYPTHALSDTVNAGATEYLCPFVDGNFSTEKAMAVTRAGTVKNFYVRQVGNQPAGGSLVCHVRKNTSTDEISITIAAGATGPATRSETSTSFTVAAGDFIGFKFVNNAGAAVSATIGFVIVEVEFDP